jgi:hypothetical protein
VGLTPNATYSVSPSRVGDVVDVTMQPGDGIRASSAGVLRLQIDADGGVSR